MKIWRNFYECDCKTEAVAMSYEYSNKKNEAFSLIDLAFFNQSMKFSRQLSFIQRLKWCWLVLKDGVPFMDMITLNKKTAKELGNDLIKFANTDSTNVSK